MKTKYIVLAILLSTSILSARPSWCRNAGTYVEYHICENPRLWELDYDLVNVYNSVKSMLRYERRERRRLIKSERNWVSRRDRDCYMAGDYCIEQKYKNRIHQLYRMIGTINRARDRY